MKLRPFFTYYGGKWRAATLYPPPIYRTIVESFAGSAGYAMRYPDRDVILYDVDPIICSVWDFIINGNSDEIMRFPLKFDHVDEVDAPQELRWLVGFWLNKGSSHSCKVPSAWMRSGIRPMSHWGEEIRRRIASQMRYVRHWKIYNKSYHDIDNIPSTYFVDPPYEGSCGRRYRFNFVDYKDLSYWCFSRYGQVIACDSPDACWLPFGSLGNIKATAGRGRSGVSREGIWSNCA